MLKGNSSALWLLFAPIWVVHSVRAESVPVRLDGCTELAQVVFAEVSAAVLNGPSKSGPWFVDQAGGNIAMCDHTAKTVSHAFTLAMNSAGFSVTWGRGSTQNEEYCWGGFLSRCYPDRVSDMPMAVTGDASTVQQTWNVVSRAVMRHMHNPYSSDEVRFRYNDLKLRLGLSLRNLDSNDRPDVR